MLPSVRYSSAISINIFQDPGVSTALHLPHLAEWLVWAPGREETLFEAIRRLPPAHALTVEKGGLEVWRYWRWDPDQEPFSTETLEENAERFLALFRQAVRDRLRAAPRRRTGAFLSGGLDSSSIATVAAQIQRSSGGLAGHGFDVFTQTFPEVDSTSRFIGKGPVEESRYARAVIERSGLRPHWVEMRNCGPLDFLEEDLQRQESPLSFPNLGYVTRLLERSRDAGVGVLLYGQGGDEIFAIGPEARRLSFLGSPVSLFRRWLRRIRWGLAQCPVPAWIRPEFARRIGLRERALRELRWISAARGSRSLGIHGLLKSGFALIDLEALGRAAAGCAVEVRSPLLDLRLLRFGAALPWQQKAGPGLSKRLMRRAMEGILPEEVRQRPRKADFTPLHLDSLKRCAPLLEEAVERPHPVLRGMVQQRELRRLRDRCLRRKGDRRPLSVKDSSDSWEMWAVLGMDVWLKHREGDDGKIRETVSAFEEVGKR